MLTANYSKGKGWGHACNSLVCWHNLWTAPWGQYACEYSMAWRLKREWSRVVAPAMSIRCQTLSDQDQTLIIHSSNHKYTNTNIQLHAWKLLCQIVGNSESTLMNRKNLILRFLTWNLFPIFQLKCECCQKYQLNFGQGQHWCRESKFVPPTVSNL